MAGDRKDSTLVQAAKYSHIGFALPAGAFAGWLIGAGLDKWLGTTWITIVGVILGIVAGFTEMIRAIIRLSKEQ